MTICEQAVADTLIYCYNFIKYIFTFYVQLYGCEYEIKKNKKMIICIKKSNGNKLVSLFCGDLIAYTNKLHGLSS